jgi:hypothetical protein
MKLVLFFESMAYTTHREANLLLSPTPQEHIAVALHSSDLTIRHWRDLLARF